MTVQTDRIAMWRGDPDDGQLALEIYDLTGRLIAPSRQVPIFTVVFALGDGFATAPRRRGAPSVPATGVQRLDRSAFVVWYSAPRPER